MYNIKINVYLFLFFDFDLISSVSEAVNVSLENDSTTWFSYCVSISSDKAFELGIQIKEEIIENGTL